MVILKKKIHPKKILFYIATPMNYAILKPIYGRLKDDRRLELWFTLRFQEKRAQRAAYNFFNEFKEGKIIKKRLARLKRFDLHLCADFGMDNSRIPVNIHLFHGVSLKNSTVRGKIKKFQKLFLVGPYMKRFIIKNKILPEHDSRMEMIGMPKLDCLVDGSLDREQIYQWLDLNPYLPTVLYAPTHSKESSLYSMGDEIIRYMGEKKINFLIKLHDLLYDSSRNPIDWREKIHSLMKPNTRLIDDYDISPYLFASDILISDASSVANEYAILDRPIIFVDVPELLKTYEKTVDLETWGRKAGVVIRNIEELNGALENAIKNPHEKSNIRKELAVDIFYKPGTATQRAVKKIYELLGMEER